MKVFINAGHGPRNNGSYDPGAVGLNADEADINLSIALKLSSLFSVTDIIPKVYQDGDLGDVCKAANDWGADWFIAIHCNANADRTANGTETLIVGTGGKAEGLAKAVQAELIRATGLKDRGVNVRPRLYVLNSTAMPAILVETAFISNANEEKLLMSEAFQSKVAIAIYNSFCEYTGYISPRERQREIIQAKLKLSSPDEFFALLDSYRYADALYSKLASAMA